VIEHVPVVGAGGLEMRTVTKEVVEAARESMVIGPL